MRNERAKAGPALRACDRNFITNKRIELFSGARFMLLAAHDESPTANERPFRGASARLGSARLAQRASRARADI